MSVFIMSLVRFFPFCPSFPFDITVSASSSFYEINEPNMWNVNIFSNSININEPPKTTKD